MKASAHPRYARCCVKEPLVELRNLSLGYGESAVLDAVCLRIPRGKVTALIGPMGAGKTTTLRLIGGECRAWSGAVLFDAQSTGVTYTVSPPLHAMPSVRTVTTRTRATRPRRAHRKPRGGSRELRASIRTGCESCRAARLRPCGRTPSATSARTGRTF